MESATGLGQPWDGILTIFGPSGFLLCVALFTVVRGDWIPRKSHDREMALLERVHAAELAAEREDKQEWQKIAMIALTHTEELTEVSKKVLVAKDG